MLWELCKAWPRKCDKYLMPACWVQRTTPDPRSNTGATPFELLFGGEARTQLDVLTPGVDGTGFGGGIDSVVAETQ